MEKDILGEQLARPLQDTYRTSSKNWISIIECLRIQHKRHYFGKDHPFPCESRSLSHGNTRASLHCGPRSRITFTLKSPSGLFKVSYLGSVRAVTNQWGSPLYMFDYDVFGTPLQDRPERYRHGFTGKEYDSWTGLYNYGFRDYASLYGRFTTVDPIQDGHNWYAYVNSDPVSWLDPWGLECPDQESGEDSARNASASLINIKNEYASVEEALRGAHSYIAKNYRGNEFSGIVVQKRGDTFYAIKIQEGKPGSVADGITLQSSGDEIAAKFHSHPSGKDILTEELKEEVREFGGKIEFSSVTCEIVPEGFQYNMTYAIVKTDKRSGITMTLTGSKSYLSEPSSNDIHNKIDKVPEYLFVPDFDDFYKY